MTRPLVFLSGERAKTKNYRKALIRAGFGITEDYRRADALCLCGGGDVAPCAYGAADLTSRDVDMLRDQKEFFYLKKFLCADKPVIAVCRGIQVVNVFFGGTLVQNVCGHDRICGLDRVHGAKFYGKLKKLYGDSGLINSAHHQAIDRLGNDLTVTAVSHDGIIEAVSGKNLSAFQFHPERLNKSVLCGEKIFASFYGEHFG